MCGNYPAGSDVSNAPWWEDYNVPDITVNACISETLHKGIKVTLPEDADLEKTVNAENWTLEETLKEAINALELMFNTCNGGDCDHIKNIINALRGWIQDERVVVQDD